MSAPVWDAGVYSTNAAHHRAYDDVFLADVAVPADARLLDIGCGSGEFTRRLAGLVPDGHVLAIDGSVSMVEHARAHQPAANVHYLVCRAEDIAARLDAWMPFDVVSSRAALHWVAAADHPRVLAGVHAVLRPGGMFRLDMGAAGQLLAARRILDEESRALGGISDPWFFPDVETYRTLLEQHGLSVERGWIRAVRQPRRLADFGALEGWLRSQVLIAYESGLPAEKIPLFTANVLGRARSELLLGDGSYDQDYVRLDVLAHRTGG